MSPSWVTPARRRGVEILDDPATSLDVRARAMADVARSNALFGGTRAVLSGLAPVLETLPAGSTLLDVGVGTGDVPERVRTAAARRGLDLGIIGLDVSADLLRAARDRLDAAVAGDALRLPLRDGAVDLVTCSQVLHHFTDGDARMLLAELHRVAKRWVVVSDLARNWCAAGGFWIAATALRFHPVTRHDGVLSVLRGFTAGELRTLVLGATGATPDVRRAPFWRLTAAWKKTGSLPAPSPV